MDKDSVLYQLMDLRINTIMNSIVNTDEEYQKILSRSDEYSERLERIGLPVDVRRLIDQYVSEQNALGARYGALAYLLGFSDCIELSRSRLDIHACAEAVLNKA